ncbi:FeoB-associated Cys-rich membrane protein [Pontibacter sp. SGAir0037]|uniref:FeoB-associated Cys-rich membrane protein n=1 Tax=Pontibacter sp. SGAir0037 TaxID=2571030 RepID=UPI0010CCEB31|nr:FeoB-associated Cys-rich membrane protein [Pontibacter sp. SGAir0037]QCR23966.1 FeoB-associated Cys-rich membrane protein [Pontibacter sp. SGAir0037]
MVQEIIILIIFLAAAFYIGRLLYRSFSLKGSSCSKGCGGACSTIDFKKIQQDLEKQKSASVS